MFLTELIYVGKPLCVILVFSIIHHWNSPLSHFFSLEVKKEKPLFYCLQKTVKRKESHCSNTWAEITLRGDPECGNEHISFLSLPLMLEYGFRSQKIVACGIFLSPLLEIIFGCSSFLLSLSVDDFCQWQSWNIY